MEEEKMNKALGVEDSSSKPGRIIRNFMSLVFFTDQRGAIQKMNYTFLQILNNEVFFSFRIE